MPEFHYKAARGDGELVEGTLDATDREGVVRALQAQGHVPIQINEAAAQKEAGEPTVARWRLGSTTSRTVDFFTLELATLLRAGLPLAQALDTLAELAEDSAAGEISTSVARSVRSGKPLSDALSDASPAFDRFYCNMVRAGESSGALDLALERLAGFRSRRRELHQALISSLIYPAILLVMATAAVLVLLAFVVPQFTEMFAEAGRELPLLTRIVAAAGDVVTRWWWLIALLILAGGYAFHRDRSTPDGRLRWDARLLKLPLVGTLVRKLHTARYTRTLATLLENGVHLVPALDIARQIVSNASMAKTLSRVTTRVREGTGLAAPLSETQVFPPLATQLVKLGEASGKLEMMLLQVSDIYERDVQTSLKRLLTLAEPLIIIVIAGLITVIILSVVFMILDTNDLAF